MKHSEHELPCGFASQNRSNGLRCGFQSQIIIALVVSIAPTVAFADDTAAANNTAGANNTADVNNTADANDTADVNNTADANDTVDAEATVANEAIIAEHNTANEAVIAEHNTTNHRLAEDLQTLRDRIIALEEASAKTDDEIDDEHPWHLEVGGYGEFSFAYHNFGPDQTQDGGSRPDHRGVFDLTRFTVELEGKLPYGFEFEAELEIEHGGTGSALELEYEEFGEFENEVEQGGEVILEELYLEKEINDNFAIMAGRFYVALGALSAYHKPNDYLGSARPESETRIIPAVWDEMGIEAHYKHPSFRATVQIVNGLDSTGFSSQQWVGSGHQQRFELVSATDLAFVGRFDYKGISGAVLGASVYVSPNSTANRPKPDLDGVSAPLIIGSTHAIVDIKPIRARASLVWGHLSNADKISTNNRRLSNNLDVLRTPVAKEAISFWTEFGVDVFHFIPSISRLHRLEPFLRFEYYDTMFDVDSEIFDNPRFKRTLLGGGLSYTFHDAIVAKLDWTHRRLGSKEFRNENTVNLSVGFIY